MKKISRRIFMTFVISMLMLLICEPILAEDIYNTEVEITDYRLAWGNGIDDNDDGVIDDWDEADVQYGAVSVDPDANVITDDWSYNFTYPGVPPAGVKIAAYMDALAEVTPNDNMSVNPIYDSYYYNFSITGTLGNVSEYETYDNTLPIIAFYVNLSPSDIMNGAQEMWYRSPLLWNSDEYNDEDHGLNIYDSDGVLVYASIGFDLDDLSSDMVLEPKMRDNRTYFKLNMNFRTEERYRFIEYIRTTDNNSINKIQLYLAHAQDIGQDGEVSTYFFPGTAHARKLNIECSWGLLCTIGIGRAGTEKLVQSPEGYNEYPEIQTNRMWGDLTKDDVDQATLILPLRTTDPLNITVSYNVWSGDNLLCACDSVIINGVTGCLIFTFNFTDPDNSEPNMYQFSFGIMNFDDVEAMTYVQYPKESEVNCVNWYTDGAFSDDDLNHSDINHFAVLFEIANENSVGGGATEDTRHTVDAASFLIGAALIIAGLILVATVVTAGVGIPLLSAGLVVGGLALGGGGYFVMEALEGHSPSQIMSSMKSGLIRAGQSVWGGLKWVGNAAWNVLAKVVEVIKEIGAAILHYGGIILGTIVEIIYLIAFLAVVWIWAKFLKIMTGIVKGDIDSALATTTQVIRKGTGVVRKVTRPAKKAGKLMRKGKR